MNFLLFSFFYFFEKGKATLSVWFTGLLLAQYEALEGEGPGRFARDKGIEFSERGARKRESQSCSGSRERASRLGLYFSTVIRGDSWRGGRDFRRRIRTLFTFIVVFFRVRAAWILCKN